MRCNAVGETFGMPKWNLMLFSNIKKYFLILEIDFLILDIHFVILEI